MATDSLRFLKTTFKVIDFESLILSNWGFVVQGIAGGLESLNLNIFILDLEVFTIELLNDS